MYLRSRHRRTGYPLVQEHSLPSGVRFLIAVGAIVFAAYLLWTLVLHLFGIGSADARTGAFLAVEDRGTVTVTIDNKEQGAENGMLLFSGESASTGPGAHASLQFFDGSHVRLDDRTQLTITKSARGDNQSTIALDLQKGSVWVSTAPQKSFTGSVAWTLTTPTLRYTLAPGTEALLSPTALTVYATEGVGITVALAGHDSFLISEGQQWTLPQNGTITGNVYDYRTPLDPLAARPQFVLDSRAVFGKATAPPQAASSGTTSAVADATETLTVTAPQDGMIVTDPTVTVQGIVGANVAQVTVNGYQALLDPVKHTFFQQVAPPEGETDMLITVQALDAQKNVLGEAQRTVKRAGPAPLGSPTITDPAAAGQTYGTQQGELILRGMAPAGAATIYVNDYKLQLFDPAKGQWSYVASLRLGTMHAGSNTYDITAADASGKKSAPARLIIVQGQGPEGVLGTQSSVGGTVASTSSTSSSSSELPQNAPLDPGSLHVTGPEAGASHTETGTGFLLEGTTSAKTASLWVNDYKLQLYKRGKTTWNYIVDVSLNNLKKGKNLYVIVARDTKDQIIDDLTYTVTYTPGSASSSSK